MESRTLRFKSAVRAMMDRASIPAQAIAEAIGLCHQSTAERRCQRSDRKAHRAGMSMGEGKGDVQIYFEVKGRRAQVSNVISKK